MQEDPKDRVRKKVEAERQMGNFIADAMLKRKKGAGREHGEQETEEFDPVGVSIKFNQLLHVHEGDSKEWISRTKRELDTTFNTLGQPEFNKLLEEIRRFAEVNYPDDSSGRVKSNWEDTLKKAQEMYARKFKK